jgi:ubiquinone/menaquinone biosynthesis C-methylase UbiE
MEAKAYKGMGMEGPIAKWYAKTTYKDLDEFKTLAKRMSEELAEGSSVLEVAPGPGYFSIELGKRGKYKITGLDISHTFVEIARKNARQESVEVDFRLGNASRMPFADDSFDLIMCRAAFKNFTEPVEALREMRRVLKKGGKAVIIDLRKDTPREEIDAYIDNMTFRMMLLKRAYTKGDFERFISESGFQDSQIAAAPLGFEIALVK